MNAMQIFSSPSIQALGWTLLHSLWQGAIVLTVSLVVIRCIPTKWSAVRYAVATGALLVIFLSSMMTFIFLNDSVDQVASDTIAYSQVAYPGQSPSAEINYVAGLLRTGTSILQYYLPLIVLCWIAGTILFTIRLFGGWLTVTRLRATALTVEGEWKERLQRLTRKLGISQTVRLAESAISQVPVVIGYFKPVILIPLGMLGGLSTEQLESIIIHELIHIRRGDYLVNLLQSVLETVFFFNPFVWIMSGIIRREREHCCDDAVVALHGNPLAYAHALTVLEEARLSRSGLALSLAEDKNQLLNRIKRIMEKSAKPYSLRERFVPAVLLITGLICASWLTIGSGESERRQDTTSTSGKVSLAPDTTIKIEKSGRYYKKSITTIGEDGKPHEEVVEEFDGDEALAPLLAPMDFDLAIPALDAISPIDAIPPVDMLTVPAFPDFKLEFNMTDTIPFPMEPGFYDMQSEFEKFSREFETEFREKFGCKVKVDAPAFDGHVMEKWAEQMEVQALKSRLIQLRQGETLAQLDQQMENFSDEMGQWAQHNARAFEELQRRQLEQLERNFQTMEVPNFDFVKAVRPELIKDGYLKEDEEIKSIEINDEVIKINGKTIKKSDRKKYLDILKKNSYGPKLHPHPGRME